MQVEVSKDQLGSRATTQDADGQLQRPVILSGPSRRTNPTLLCREDSRQGTAAGFTLALCVFPSLESILKQHWEKNKDLCQKSQ